MSSITCLYPFIRLGLFVNISAMSKQQCHLILQCLSTGHLEKAIKVILNFHNLCHKLWLIIIFQSGQNMNYQYWLELELVLHPLHLLSRNYLTPSSLNNLQIIIIYPGELKEIYGIIKPWTLVHSSSVLKLDSFHVGVKSVDRIWQRVHLSGRIKK